MNWTKVLFERTVYKLSNSDTGFIFISASTAIVGRPSCRLQLVVPVSAIVNMTQQQLAQVSLLQRQLSLALHPDKVWDTQHGPSSGFKQLVSAFGWACSTCCCCQHCLVSEKMLACCCLIFHMDCITTMCLCDVLGKNCKVLTFAILR